VDFSGLGYLDLLRYESIKDKANYRIAFPAEMAVAINGSLPEYRPYLVGLKFTGKYYWPVMTEYLKNHSPIKCR
jgi:hypothetical protein